MKGFWFVISEEEEEAFPPISNCEQVNKMDDFLFKKFTRRDFLGNTAKICFLVGLPSIFLQGMETVSSSNEPRNDVEKSGATGSDFEPAYQKLHQTGELKERWEKLWAMVESCRLCTRGCGENRLERMRGTCRSSGTRLVVSSYQATLAKKDLWWEQAVPGPSFFPIAVYGVSSVKTGKSAILAEALKQVLMNLPE